MKIKHVNFLKLNKNNCIWSAKFCEQKVKMVIKQTTSNDNYSQKHYNRNENGALDYKIKISSDALRNAIFTGDAIGLIRIFRNTKYC
jgi:hypothetical protein